MMKKKDSPISVFPWIIFLSVVLASCASVTPVPPQNLNKIVRDSVPLENEQIVFSHNFEWLPGTYGYEKTMQRKIDRVFYKGILSCTERNLYFLAIMGNQYVPRLKLEYTEIINVDLQKYGLGRRLIIQNKKYETHTFQALSASGYGVDRKKTETTYLFIKERSKR